MMKSRLAPALVVVAAVTVTSIHPIRAQVSADLGAGVVFPLGAVDQVAQVGPTVRLGIAYNLSHQLTFEASTSSNWMGGQCVDGLVASQCSAVPAYELGVWQYGVGIRYALTPDAPLKLALLAGVGATTTRGRFLAHPADLLTATPGTLLQFRDTRPMLDTGLRVDWQALSRMSLFLDGRVNWVFGDESRTQIFSVATDGAIHPFRMYGTLPLVVGLRIRF